MSSLPDLAQFGRRTLEREEPALLAQVVRVEGSHYRRPGARMILTEQGASAGSLSAGCLEADLARLLPQVWAGGRPVLVEYDSRGPEEVVWGLGLGCGGKVAVLLTPLEEGTVSRLEEIARQTGLGRAVRVETAYGSGEHLAETIEPPILLLVCGAGSDAPPLIRQGAALGWSVKVVAPRPTAAAARRLDAIAPDGLHAPEDLARLVLRHRAAAVVMTHNFLDDLSFLRRLLPLSVGYLGVLGPRERTTRLQRALAEEDPISSRHSPTLFSPVGLDIGAESPEEIALAIAAEIHASMKGRAGGFLRDRPGPIHDRAGGEPGGFAGESRRSA